jgi:uncharacterized protein with beta-barrel porin domain
MRTRATGLMSGVSVLAVMAALASPASAGETFGPGQVGRITNHGTTDFIQIVPGTIVDALGNKSITNTGSIVGGSTAIAIAQSHLSGGISNHGVIDGFTYGMNLVGATSTSQVQVMTTIEGSITNTGVISGGFAGINTAYTSIQGGIENRQSGVIGAEGGIGLLFSSTVIEGGIANKGTIHNVIAAALSLKGGFSNTGIITGCLCLSPGTFSIGSFTSDGVIEGDIVNDGTIEGVNFFGGVGGSIHGDFINNGLVANEVFFASLPNFVGDVVNTGTIQGDFRALSFVDVDLHGDIINAAGASIVTAQGQGIWSASNVTHANVFNYGTITAGNYAIDFTWFILNGIDVPTLFGSVTNAGELCGAAGGIRIQLEQVFGSITNSGAIGCADTGTAVFVEADVSGDITNSGTITTGAGIFVVGDVGGAVVNTGVIQTQGNAIQLFGSVAGGIYNSGTLSGSVGIATGSGTGPQTITQTAGLIQGKPTALNIGNSFVDTFVGIGGTLDGNVSADGDVLNFAPTQTFSWLRGFGFHFGDISKTGAGTLVLGASARGAQSTDALTAYTAQMELAQGRMYLDDQVTINITGLFTQYTTTNPGAYVQSAGTTLEFFLTSDSATHGRIAAESLSLDGTIAAYLDPVTLAANAISVGTTFTYDDVLTGVRTGVFSNGTNLVTSSPFFRGTVVYNASDIDLQLERISFRNAFPNATANQAAVGEAFDNLAQTHGLTAGMNALVAAAFAGSWNFDELSGAQFTQLRSAAQGVTSSINSMIGERLDNVSFTSGATFDPESAFASTRSTDSVAADGTSIWLRRFGEEEGVSANALAPGYAQESKGLVAGFDFALTDAAKAGAAYGHMQSEVAFTTRGDSARIDTWQMNAYGAYRFDRFYADTQASFGRHDVAAARIIDLPLLGSTRATANYAATSWSAASEFGATWQAGRVALKPALGVAYVGMSSDPFVESGSSYALRVGGSQSTSLASTLALAASGRWTLGETAITPSVKFGWRHEFADQSETVGASFVEGLGADTAMLIASSDRERDSFVLSAGTMFAIGVDTEAFVALNGRYDESAATTDASAGVRFTW